MLVYSSVSQPFHYRDTLFKRTIFCGTLHIDKRWEISFIVTANLYYFLCIFIFILIFRGTCKGIQVEKHWSTGWLKNINTLRKKLFKMGKLFKKLIVNYAVMQNKKKSLKLLFNKFHSVLFIYSELFRKITFKIFSLFCKWNLLSK